MQKDLVLCEMMKTVSNLGESLKDTSICGYSKSELVKLMNKITDFVMVESIK